LFVSKLIPPLPVNAIVDGEYYNAPYACAPMCRREKRSLTSAPICRSGNAIHPIGGTIKEDLITMGERNTKRRCSDAPQWPCPTRPHC
ncbi:MAG: hypothetical protein ACREDY_08280, partial [Bradyrhizobium sp.]